jgi:hypothetical protein
MLLLAAPSPSAAPAAGGGGASASSPSPAPLPIAAPSQDPSPPPTPRDRVANLVGGVWQCDTIGGSTATHTYSENDDGSIELQTELHAGFRTFRIMETYRFDDTRNTWTVNAGGGAYTGTASTWSGYKWVFDGVERLRGQSHPVRMVYYDLADQAFRRDFQALQDGVWRTYSAETCKRPSR